MFQEEDLRDIRMRKKQEKKGERKNGSKMPHSHLTVKGVR